MATIFIVDKDWFRNKWRLGPHEPRRLELSKLILLEITKGTGRKSSLKHVNALEIAGLLASC